MIKKTLKKGVKFDAGKPEMGLISSEFLVGLAKVLTFGARKYAAHNWRKGLQISKCYNALQRHLVDFWNGRDYDWHPESCEECSKSKVGGPWLCNDHSGQHLLDNAACELMFIRELVVDQPKLDDRYKRVRQ